MIVGLDTDSAETPSRIIEFIDQSKIPMLTINLLQALPRTPLWDRLARDNRIAEDESRESNVVFKMPYDDTIAMWRTCLEHAYDPQRLFARYDYQIAHTHANRRPRPVAPELLTLKNIRAWAVDAVQGVLEARRCRRLSAPFLELRLAAHQRRAHRTGHIDRHYRQASHHVLAQRPGRRTQRLALFPESAVKDFSSDADFWAHW